MKVIGIVGGIGSGKSLICEYIKNNYNACFINADGIGHQVLEKNTDVYNQVFERYGKQILNADGSINRKALGDIVFSASEDLKWLNSVSHPYIKSKIIKKIEEYKEKKSCDLIILEAAILIEAGWGQLADYIILVKCKEDIRVERLINSRSITEQKAKTIISKQSTDIQLERFSDEIIDNSLDKNNSYKQIDIIIKKILEDHNE